MNKFNFRDFDLRQAIKKRADIEAQILCHLWSDPEERNHLDFTETPPLPRFEKPKVVRDKVGWKMFTRMVRELKC